MEAILVLEDGRVFKGTALGKGTTWGEVVFNTSMTGYEEIMTDPAYRGQLVTLTYPLIGNYGINGEDVESYQPHLAGLIIKESCMEPSHWQSNQKLSDFLKEENIMGIADIDTRALTRHIREEGSMFGVISSEKLNPEELQKLALEKAKEDRNLVEEVSIKEPSITSGDGPRVVVMDFGVKYNILRRMKEKGAEIIVVPHNTTAEEVLDYKPDGILLSSGPGDPRDIPEIVDEIKKLIGKIPIFGICLGHQLLGLAFGGTIYKLKFGHHGGNHPVKDLTTGKIKITTQNHGYALDNDLHEELEITHKNLNDGTVEGIKHKKLPVFSLQYHPEAGPGPNDSNHVFNDFIKIITDKQQKEIVNF